ncbi:hypothetical protein H311_00790 [Anncaliia algerae PRA109]|nr:hypothetical protein H311_00790 [Anncaliia algerae PRA109]
MNIKEDRSISVHDCKLFCCILRGILISLFAYLPSLSFYFYSRHVSFKFILQSFHSEKYLWQFFFGKLISWLIVFSIYILPSYKERMLKSIYNRNLKRIHIFKNMCLVTISLSLRF